MARKPAPESLRAPGGDPALTASDPLPPLAGTFDVEFPPELVQEETERAVVLAPAPVAPVAPIVESVRVGVAAKPGSALASLEEARRIYQEEVAKARATADAAGRPPDEFQFRHDGTDYDQLPTITEGFTAGATKLGRQLTERFKAELSAALQTVSYQNAVARFRLSDSLWTKLQPDYAETVKQAGLVEKIAVDEGGQPKHPDKYDGLLWQLLLLHPDPGQYAYGLAQEMLAQGVAAQASAGGGNGAVTRADVERAREEGRRGAEATRIHDLERAELRPVGIAGIPAAAGVRRTISLTDIGAMSDAQQTWIQEHHPKHWEDYKRSLFHLSPK